MRLLVAVPAWNEQEIIADVISMVQLRHPTSQILVVDDGSTDATQEIARKCGAVVLSPPFNVGVGGGNARCFPFCHSNVGCGCLAVMPSVVRAGPKP